MRTLMLMVATVILLAVGCSGNDPGSLSDDVTSAEEETGEEPKEVVKELDLYGWHGVASLEEMIASSSIIVRARFVSATPVGVRSALATMPDSNGVYQVDGYQGSLELTFNVLEYLKGSGGSQVKGIAYGTPFQEVKADTAERAAELARPLLDGRDKRWDDREAIVFLRPARGLEYNPHLSVHLDHYWLGAVASWPGSNRQVTVASGEGRAWLPKTATTTPGAGSGTRSVSKEQHFLLEDPATSGSGATTRSSSSATGGSVNAPGSSTISLTSLKSKISAQETAASASSDADAYRTCLALTHQDVRQAESETYRAYTSTVESGMAAGETVYTYGDAVRIHLRRFGSTEPADFGQVWYEGRDSHLLTYEYPGYLNVVRPLPAGEYRAFLLSRDARMVICDGYPESLREKTEHIITVTAPDGTLAEAFYDLVTDGDAVTATTTVGTISWETDEVEAALTVAGTARHVLDFIELDGSVSLSLAIDDATDTDGTLSWPVPTQPWENGDQLMLRVRRLP